jgi:sulfite reductase (ferredoxin)
VGLEEFSKLYKKERETLKSDGLPYAAPEIRDIGSVYEVPEASTIVRLRLKNGDIPADDLRKVGQIAARYSRGLIRTTQLQDLLITGIAKQDTDKVNSELKKLSVNVLDDGGPKIVACAGALTCKLGLCFSRGLADAISDKLNQVDLSETTIRISGCPNSCGHHYIAGIGFQGRAKRVNGKLMPCYDVMVGAKTIEGDAHLAETIGTVPAKRIPDLLVEALSNGTVEKKLLKSLVVKSRRAGISVESLPEDYYYDYGSDEPFSLAGRGPGECGAGVMDVIKLDIDEAKNAVKSTGSENIYKAIVAAARALLVTFGLEPKKDRETFAAFTRCLIEPGWVKHQSRKLLDDAIDWRMGDRKSIDDLLGQVEDLVKRVEELFLSLDANLKFKVEPTVQKANIDKAETNNHIIDLRGVACPLNFVKAKLELEKIETGAILEVLLDEGEPARNVPESFAQQGQEVMEVKNLGDYFCVKVRRKK